MGTWGTALFSDDLASDVRGDFRELIGEGHTSAEATEILLRQYDDALVDQDEGPVFWLALAAIQWKAGRLEESVKAKALEILDSGEELNRWREDSKLLKRREAVLAKLREQLLSPPPPPRKFPKVFKNANDWEVGEIVSYQLNSGLNVLFRVIGHHVDKGGRFAVCELLDWVGSSLPEPTQLAIIPIKRESNARGISQFMLGEPKGIKKGGERLVRLGIKMKPSQKPGGYAGFPWQYLDRMLEEIFGIT